MSNTIRYVYRPAKFQNNIDTDSQGLLILIKILLYKETRQIQCEDEIDHKHATKFMKQLKTNF